MKNKIFTLLLSGALILGSAGSAMAAEKGICSTEQFNSEKLQSMLKQYLCKYFEGNCGQNPDVPEIEKPEAPEKPEIPEKPEAPQKPQVPEVNNGTMSSQVAALVNQERQNAGLNSLKSDSKLTELAQKKAMDMAEKGYFSHTSPTYGSAFDMLKAAGYSYRTAGENIAKGQKTAASVMNGWMNSSGHRANILGSGYTKIGVGYSVSANGTPYWVQIFAG